MNNTEFFTQSDYIGTKKYTPLWLTRSNLEAIGVQGTTSLTHVIVTVPIEAQRVLVNSAKNSMHATQYIGELLALFGFDITRRHTSTTDVATFAATYFQRLPNPAPAASGGSRGETAQTTTAEFGEFAFVNCIRPGEGYRLLRTLEAIQETDEGTSDPKGRVWDKSMVVFARQPFCARTFAVRRRIAAEVVPPRNKVVGLFPEVGIGKPADGRATNIREFPSGAVRDVIEGKEDYIESTSFVSRKRFADYMTRSMVKYGPGNWRKGIPLEEYEKSLYRHWQKYLSNKYDGTDVEPEIDHLAAVMFNLQGIMHEEAREESRVAEAADKLRKRWAAPGIHSAMHGNVKQMFDNTPAAQTKVA